MILKAVIFDFDDLLADTIDIHREANKKFLEGYGRLYLPGKGSHSGMRMVEIIRDYKDIYDLPGKVDDLYKERQTIFYNLVKEKLKLFDSAWDVVNKLRKKGLRLALATSGDRGYIDTVFHKYPQLASLFEIIVTSESITRGKPFPDVYLKAVNALSIKPEEAVVIEDSLNGVAAAKAAGIQVICIPHPDFSQLDYSLADKVFVSLKELSDSIV